MLGYNLLNESSHKNKFYLHFLSLKAIFFPHCLSNFQLLSKLSPLRYQRYLADELSSYLLDIASTFLYLTQWP